MALNPDFSRKKVQACYKTLYISDELAEKVNRLSIEKNTSFNNIVIKILENFFEEYEKESK